MNKKRLITSALPYVNNVPHLGNIIGCVLSADVFARYCRMAGYETMFIGGTDEYGTTTETRALQEGLTPKELCDKYHKIHKDIYEWLEVDFSHFGRSSCPEQTTIVQDIFLKLYKNGYILEDTLTQPYCERDRMFLADRYVEGTCPHCGYEEAKGDQCEKCGKLLDAKELKDPKCTICKTSPIFRDTKHLFIDLEKLKPDLEKWIDSASKEGGWSYNALSTTRGWIEQGLKKRCITRDLKWGVPVPLKGYEDKVFYVWFDAPIGYISITASKFPEWESWWKNPENIDLYQFMGKDNIPFHTVIFPSSLIGTKEKWTMLKTISSTEYLNYEGQKFSKSKGIGVSGEDAIETGIDPDLYRYYLVRNRPEKNDTQFLWNDFMEKTNGEIIANYANLVNRTLQFVDRFFDGVVPAFGKTGTIFEKMNIFEAKQKIVALFEKIELKNALMSILEICSEGNKFFQDSEPWVLIKNDREKTADVIGSLAAFVRDITIMLSPFIPKAAAKVMAMYNLNDKDMLFDNIGNHSQIINKKINKPEILFTRLEKELTDELRKKYSAGKTEEKIMDNPFAKIKLKAGVIIAIEKHPKADKLYIEKVDLGNGEIRQIVSGLVPYYKEEELLNKKIILVSNLKPAVLRGTPSEGMLLAAENADKSIVEVISPDCGIGELITVDGIVPEGGEITIDDFFSIEIKVDGFVVNTNGNALKAGGKPVKVEKVESGKVR